MPNNITKKNLRKKWIEMANEKIRNNIEKQQLEMFKSIEKQQLEIKKLLTVEEYIDNEKYLTALKYINRHYPEFILKKPKIYKWLKKAINTNANELTTENVENIKEVNLRKFTIPEGNDYEYVNVNELFGNNNNKEGGRRRKTLKRKSNKRRN
jgi:hypothetical protein